MTQRRVTRVEMVWLVDQITSHATTLNLLPQGAAIYWIPGNVTQGHAPQVQAMIPRADGGITPIPVSFLPEFGYRDSTKDAHRALMATYKVLDVLAGRERR